jgi:hypothetical protein
MRSACLATVLLAALPASAAAQTRIFDIVVSGPIGEVPVSLIARRTSHTIQLKNVQAGAAPVVAIVAERGGDVPGITRHGARVARAGERPLHTRHLR